MCGFRLLTLNQDINRRVGAGTAMGPRIFDTDFLNNHGLNKPTRIYIYIYQYQSDTMLNKHIYNLLFLPY